MIKDILYTFRRCPYAMRARWALLKANKSVIWREVDLKNKPPELIQLSASATVPLLITAEGQILRESYDIMIWSLNFTKPHQILLNKGTHSYKKAMEFIYINDCFFKFHLDRYKYSKNNSAITLNTHREIAKDILIRWNNNLSSKSNGDKEWLIDGEESIADWAIWPFVRQFRLVDPDSFDADRHLNKLGEWLKQFSNNDLFPILMQKAKPWNPEEPEIFFPMNDNTINYE